MVQLGVVERALYSVEEIELLEGPLYRCWSIEENELGEGRKREQGEGERKRGGREERRSIE